MELSQVQSQLQDMPGPAPKQESASIFKHLILPLLSAVECGGFFIFASPTIYIQGYSDDGAMRDEAPDSARGPAGGEDPRLGQHDKALSQLPASRAGDLPFLGQKAAPRERTTPCCWWATVP